MRKWEDGVVGDQGMRGVHVHDTIYTHMHDTFYTHTQTDTRIHNNKTTSYH